MEQSLAAGKILTRQAKFYPGGLTPVTACSLSPFPQHGATTGVGPNSGGTGRILTGLAIFYPPGQNFDRLQSRHKVSRRTPSMAPLLDACKILTGLAKFCSPSQNCKRNSDRMVKFSPGWAKSACLVRILTLPPVEACSLSPCPQHGATTGIGQNADGKG